MQRTAACHHAIADALLPQADPICDDATTRHTAVDMLDAQPTVVQPWSLNFSECVETKVQRLSGVDTCFVDIVPTSSTMQAP